MDKPTTRPKIKFSYYYKVLYEQNLHNWNMDKNIIEIG